MKETTFSIMEISANSLKACPHAHFFYSCVNTARVSTYEHENVNFLLLLELPKCVQFCPSSA